MQRTIIAIAAAGALLMAVPVAPAAAHDGYYGNHGYYGRHGGYYGNGYRPHWHGGIGLGLLGAAIVGGTVAVLANPPPVYYAPPPPPVYYAPAMPRAYYPPPAVIYTPPPGVVYLTRIIHRGF
jgi:hypothetical protein